jgi:hypothetical protein
MNGPEEFEWEAINDLRAKYDGKKFGLPGNYPKLERTPKPKPGVEVKAGSPLWLELSAGDNRVRCGKGWLYLMESKNNYPLYNGEPGNFMEEVMAWYGGKAKFGSKLWNVEYGRKSGLAVCRSKVVAQRIRGLEVYIDGHWLRSMLEWALRQGVKPVPCNKKGRNPSLCFRHSPEDYRELKEHGRFRFSARIGYRVPHKEWGMIDRLVIRKTKGFVSLSEVEKEYADR